MSPEGHHDIDAGSPVKCRPDNREQLGEWQVAGAVGDQHQDMFPRHGVFESGRQHAGYLVVAKGLAGRGSRRDHLLNRCRHAGSYPRRRREAAVHRDHGPCYESAGVGCEPEHGADEVFWAAQPAHGCAAHYRSAPLGERPVGFGEQGPVLVPEEEARGNGVYPDARAHLAGDVVGQPAGEVFNPRLGCAVADDT